MIFILYAFINSFNLCVVGSKSGLGQELIYQGLEENKKVLGLSKMNRVVEYFSRRPQIQERLTEQIYHALSFILETDNVALTIDAKHFCVKSRGVEDTECSTITSRLGGNFKAHPEVRAEFLALLKM